MTWRPVEPGAAPAWFTKALATPYQDRIVAVEGAPIHYLDWGNPGEPGLILIHGGAAHAHWWTFLGPFFAERWHVVAMDMSGHGDSGHRDDYSHETWSEEVMAVAADAGFPGPPVIVGHSLGGMVTISTAARFSDELAGAVLVDSPVRGPDPETEESRGGRAFRAPGRYPDLATALTHFRVVPEQPNDNAFIIDHIARHSLTERDGEWTWKFDPALFRHALIPLDERLRSITCRLALLRGELSVVVPPDTAEYMYELMGRLAPVASIPDAHHHLILDQPLAFVAALRTLLADWDHSTPRRRRRMGAHPVVALTGAVSRPGHLTEDDLAGMDGAVADVSGPAAGAVGPAVPAAALVAAAAPQAEATHCTVISTGGAYRASIPLEDLVASGWLAYGLSDDRGGPFRLTVAAGRTLCWNVKEVAELRFTAGPEPDDVPENPGH